MPLRSLFPSRLAAAGLVLAGAMAATTGGAAAQYYEPYDVPYPRAYGYSYSDVYDGYYGQRVVPPRVVNRIAARDFGLVRVDRTVRTGSSHVIDGVGVDGTRLRLIFDARSGAFLDRIVLNPAPPRQRVARIDPRLDEKAVKRLTPRPPERPAELKLPSQAAAPATAIPPSPATPPRAEPAQPAPAAPAEASAPATAIPPAPAVPRDNATPETEPKKPRIVYPSPIQDPSTLPRADAEKRAPPVAKAEEPVIAVPPVVDLPPVQIQDLAPATPKPETPAVPVTPME